MNEERYTSDNDVMEMEIKHQKLSLYVCSTCGLISNRLIDHGDDCTLQDWWHLNAVCREEHEE